MKVGSTMVKLTIEFKLLKVSKLLFLLIYYLLIIHTFVFVFIFPFFHFILLNRFFIFSFFLSLSLKNNYLKYENVTLQVHNLVILLNLLFIFLLIHTKVKLFEYFILLVFTFVSSVDELNSFLFSSFYSLKLVQY